MLVYQRVTHTHSTWLQQPKAPPAQEPRGALAAHGQRRLPALSEAGRGGNIMALMFQPCFIRGELLLLLLIVIYTVYIYILLLLLLLLLLLDLQ